MTDNIGSELSGRVTLPEDRMLKDIPVLLTVYRPLGYLVVYENLSVEVKCEGHISVLSMDSFLETMGLVSDLNIAFICIMNTEEPERSKLIKHLNSESRWWDDEE